MQKSEPKHDGVELESQFILRVPEEAAKILREAIQTGANNLKDRFTIRLDQDLRHGEVRLDHFYLHAKIVDLPTIIESLKTFDLKSFYKAADICQLMICKEEPDPITTDEEPQKNKKKDPNKVDKKYLWPHGVCPPTKNVRKRRFRKTLKKKYVELPEIEKEVKRLLRVDNEAVNVKWELITAEDEEQAKDSKEHLMDAPKGRGKGNQKGGKNKAKDTEAAKSSQMKREHLDEHDIFGEEVSDSEDEEDTREHINPDIDENSCLSDSNSMVGPSQHSGGMSFEFNKNMFNSPSQNELDPRPGTSSNIYGDDNDDKMSKETINARINDVNRELADLQNQRVLIEQQIQKIDNKMLRERLQDDLDNLLSSILDKEMDLQELQNMQ